MSAVAAAAAMYLGVAASVAGVGRVVGSLVHSYGTLVAYPEPFIQHAGVDPPPSGGSATSAGLFAGGR